MRGSVSPLRTPPPQHPPGGADDGGDGGGVGSNALQRLAAIEAHMTHMATKAWVLGGVVGGMGLAAAITLAVMRLFMQSN